MSYYPAAGGRFTAINCSLKLLTQDAFHIMPFQIAKIPDWANSERSDIAAKAEEDVQQREIPISLIRAGARC